MNKIDDDVHFFHEDQVQVMRRKMVKALIISVGVMILISFVLLRETATNGFIGAYFLGAFIGLLNGVIGFVTIEKFIDRSSLVFMKGVFAGMGIRLLLMLVIFVILIEVFKVHIVALVTGLLIFYFAMTIFEIIFLNKRIALKASAKGSVS